MGTDDGFADESPAATVAVPHAFWIFKHEFSTDIYALFDPAHDSGTISRYNKDQSNPGEPANGPRQPVIRVAWHDARRFCAWLSTRSGLRCDLPTEAQWEYAGRAGSQRAMSYGPMDADFGRFANLADRRLLRLLIRDSPPWLPHAAGVDDRAVGPADVGRYEPNAWRLHDMHGNVAEWTRSLYRPYPWRDEDGRNDLVAQGPRVIRGGSWRDRPWLARSAMRAAREPWGRYADVGFRVVAEEVAPTP